MTFSRVLILALLAALVVSASAPAAVRLASRDEPLPATSASLAHARGAVTVLPARTAPFRFNLVGLHWRGAGEVWFRTARSSGGWSAWRRARPEVEDLPDAGTREAGRRAGWKLGNPYWTGSARRIQYRVAGRVTRLRAHFLWSAPTAAPVLGRTAAAVPAAPAIVSRAQWGADESIVREKPSYADRVAFAVVHHTAGSSPTSPSQSAAIVRGIQTYHVKSNGWNDIGYNFLVDPFGQVFEGRAGGVTRNVVGAHAQGFNTGSSGVAVLGTYESTTIASAARNALADLLAWRLDLAHVDPASRLTWVSGGNPRFPAGTSVSLAAVSGHRDTGSTSCPGSALYGTLGRLATDAAARGGPKLFAPRVQGAVGGPVRFTARLSIELPWSVTVRDGAGTTVGVGTGYGSAVDWTWDARSAPPGRYTYAIEAGPDVRPARGVVGGGAALAISALTVKPAVVTPNGDGVTDVMRVTVGLTTAATLDAWLETPAGLRIATLAAGRSVPAGTAQLAWRGSGAGETPAPDGSYRLVVEARAGAERVSQTAGVVVDRTLGRLTARPATFSPNGDGRRDAAEIAFDLTRPASVRIRVLAGARTVATLLSGPLEAGSRHSVEWNGRAGTAPVADGRYRAVVEATTSLGTRRLEASLVLDTKRPRVTLLSATRSRGGTQVRLTLSERARLTVRMGATTVRTTRRAGRVALWRAVRPRTVRVVAEDAAANLSRPASARVRG